MFAKKHVALRNNRNLFVLIAIKYCNLRCTILKPFLHISTNFAYTMNKLTNIKHYKKEYVRALYGKLGKDSGLNPGVLWPRKEELEHLKQYEKAFTLKLDSLIEENRLKKEAALNERMAREKEVSNNLKKLPGELKQFFDKIEDKKKQKEDWVRQRETLIEEVREILGYRAKPSDERFQEALAKKEEEDAKAKRKEERKRKENAKLDELL